MVRAPADTNMWAFQACVSRVRAAIEDLSSLVPGGAPWAIVAGNGWRPAFGVHVQLELETICGTDAECDLGIALLERVAGEIERRQAA